MSAPATLYFLQGFIQDWQPLYDVPDFMAIPMSGHMQPDSRNGRYDKYNYQFHLCFL